MKKTLSFILSLVMIISTLTAMPFNTFAETKVGSIGADVTYSLDTETNILTVSGTGSTNDYSEPAFPSSIRTGVKKIVIEEGITNIASYVFSRFSDVTEIEFPSTLERIGFYSFSFCTSLEEISFPDNVTTLGGSSFGYCSSLKSITIGKGMNSVSSSAFDTKSLLSFTVHPENQYYSTVDGNLYNANKTTFIKYCAGKTETSFTIPENVTSIASYAFSSCEKGVSPLTTIVLPSSLKELKNYSLRGFGSLEEITIPNGLETIGTGAFMYCDSLREINLPDSVKTINNRAFENCLFTSFNIPSSVISISPEALVSLYYCTEFTVDPQNKMYKSVDGVLYTKNNETLINYPMKRSDSSYVVLNGTKEINSYAFYYSKFQNIVLPDTIEMINEFAFYKSYVTSINISNSIKAIDRKAFADTYYLTDITIQNPYVSIAADNNTLGYQYSSKAITYHVYNKCDGSASNVETWVNANKSDYSVAPVIDSLGNVSHNYGKPVPNEDDTHTLTCKNCGYKQSEACTIVTLPQVDATCLKDGHTAGEICSKCNYMKTGEIIPATGSHDFSFVDADIISEPSCSSTGLRTAYYECNNCSTPKVVNETIEKLPHSYVIQPAVEATCVEDGLTEGEACSVCGFVNKTQIKVIALGHDLETAAAVEATCFSKGLAEGQKCKRCDYVDQEEIPMLPHSLKTTTTKATTKADGKIVKSCTNAGCTYKTTKAINKIGTTTLSTTKYTYDGKAKKPAVTVKDSKGNKISSSNYTVTYSNNTKVGKATVKITFKGNYSGTVSKTFTIVPKSTSISSLTAVSKGFTVKWKKQATQTTGYQIQIATDSGFTKGVKSYTATSNSTVSKKITSLTGGKKYYVRIRTYKTVSGTKYYSSWSASKYVTTKK